MTSSGSPRPRLLNSQRSSAVGPTMAATIADWFSVDWHREIVRKWRVAGPMRDQRQDDAGADPGGIVGGGHRLLGRIHPRDGSGGDHFAGWQGGQFRVQKDVLRRGESSKYDKAVKLKGRLVEVPRYRCPVGRRCVRRRPGLAFDNAALA